MCVFVQFNSLSILVDWTTSRFYLYSKRKTDLDSLKEERERERDVIVFMSMCVFNPLVLWKKSIGGLCVLEDLLWSVTYLISRNEERQFCSISNKTREKKETVDKKIGMCHRFVILMWKWLEAMSNIRQADLLFSWNRQNNQNFCINMEIVDAAEKLRNGGSCQN